MIRIKSLLRYPGSKGNMADDIIRLMPEHKSYLEPFFGSGAVLFKKAASPIETINDLDDDIINLFTVIRKWPEELAKVISLTPYSRTEYNNSFSGTSEDDEIERARKFMVRSLQSHGFRCYEKSGWKNDVQGREKSYCVSHWCDIPRIIGLATQRLRQVQIEHMDAIELIKRFDYPNVFIYLDPPYVLGTRTRKQYNHEMSDEEHVRLLETILQSKAKIMISGYHSDLYESYLGKWNSMDFNATAEHGLKRTEVLWMNYKKDMDLFDLIAE